MDQSPAKRAEALRNYLQGFKPEQLQKFLNRAYLDLLKSPSQKTAQSPRQGRKSARKAKRSTKRR
jgi:hypothetical protein